MGQIIPMSQRSRPQPGDQQPKWAFSLRPKSEPPADLAYTCEKCGTFVNAHWFKDAWHHSVCNCVMFADEAGRRRAEHEIRLARIGLTGPRLPHYRLNKFDPSDNPLALAAAEQFLRLHIAACESPVGVTGRNTLVLQSKERGIGKTMLAAAIINESMQEAYKRAGYRDPAINDVGQRLLFARWAYGPHIHSWALTKPETDSFGNTQRFDSLMKCRLLVLDDVGQEHRGAGNEHNPSWQQHNYTRIIEERYSRGLSTIITTNETDLKGLIGASAFDRLEGAFVLMHGLSRRQGLELLDG